MINRRRVYGGSKNLPYDAEIEYLESSGTQWIDTNCPISLNTVIKSIVYVTKNSRDNTFFSTYVTKGDGTTALCVRLQGYKGNIYCNLFGSTSGLGSQQGKHFIEMGSTYVKFDNMQIGISPTITSILSSFTTTLFVILKPNGEVVNYAVNQRIYSFQQYDGSQLQIDLIPVRIGTTGYLYDKVSGQLFGNAGTGEFILGPDK